MQVVASMFDMLLIARINIAWGVSDKTSYMFGDAVPHPQLCSLSLALSLSLSLSLSVRMYIYIYI